MKRSVVRTVPVAGILSVVACGSATAPDRPAPEIPKFSCVANSQTMRLPANLRATLPNFGPRDPDDTFVALANSLPGGFAGIYIESGRYVVTFVDVETAERSKGEIEQTLFDKKVLDKSVNPLTIDFRSARWTFAELDEWFRYIVPKVATPGSGVSSSDIDEKANTVALTVIDEASRALLEQRLAALGISCNLLTTAIMPYAVEL